MKIKTRVCDICGKDLYEKPVSLNECGAFSNDINPLKIKMKVKRYSNPWKDYLSPWDKIEVCTECANRIYNYCKRR